MSVDRIRPPLHAVTYGRIPRRRHRHRHRHPREDPRKDVGVSDESARILADSLSVGVGVDVGVVECGLMSSCHTTAAECLLFCSCCNRITHYLINTASSYRRHYQRRRHLLLFLRDRCASPLWGHVTRPHVPLPPTAGPCRRPVTRYGTHGRCVIVAGVTDGQTDGRTQIIYL